MDPNEVVEADEETLPYAEEDWQEHMIIGIDRSKVWTVHSQLKFQGY